MIFPVELDNRSLRLFVQHTCTLVNRNMPLSRLETKMVVLLQQHPDLGFICNKPVDIDQVFDDPTENPFLKLSALWQVEQQWEKDQPRGFRNAVRQAFKSDILQADEWSMLAEAYLTLYLQNQADLKSMNEFEYIVNLCSLLGEPQAHIGGRDFHRASKSSSNDGIPRDLGSSGLVTSMIADCFRSLHRDASSLPVRPRASLSTLLSNLPIDWLDASLRYWELPETHLKRDKVKVLSSFLTHPDHRPKIFGRLHERERELLQIILSENGWVEYGRLAALFGTEENDGYWWSKEPPQSLIGGLRLKGLLFIGRMTLDSKSVHIAMIAKQLVPLLTTMPSLSAGSLAAE